MSPATGTFSSHPGSIRAGVENRCPSLITVPRFAADDLLGDTRDIASIGDAISDRPDRVAALHFDHRPTSAERRGRWGSDFDWSRGKFDDGRCRASEIGWSIVHDPGRGAGIATTRQGRCRG